MQYPSGAAQTPDINHNTMHYHKLKSLSGCIVETEQISYTNTLALIN